MWRVRPPSGEVQTALLILTMAGLGAVLMSVCRLLAWETTLPRPSLTNQSARAIGRRSPTPATRRPRTQYRLLQSLLRQRYRRLHSRRRLRPYRRSHLLSPPLPLLRR